MGSGITFFISNLSPETVFKKHHDQIERQDIVKVHQLSLIIASSHGERQHGKVKEKISRRFYWLT
jgi:hypothetical protein